ncbi:hypothetical protein GTP58_06665 [Duganella sp. CY15W]|uniref:hypothetical protein n=1 Tax=Duganella sp. CY15W TaxID=2692172 RepID=UPI00136F8B09|nr:hypothetical protein [Duganella sp. CY15W]MYM27999.1 hypothetical protein [Duganella sp. CY15W]
MMAYPSAPAVLESRGGLSSFHIFMYKSYLKLKPRSRRKILGDKFLDGDFFFSEDVADSPCEAAFYIIPHKSEPMFKVGWGVAADRRLDKINEIWGGQLNIYCALVIATSREAAINAETTMKLILRRHGWRVPGLPPLEGQSEFFCTEGLLFAYKICMNQLFPTMQALEENTHVITARGKDQTSEEMFADIVKKQAGKSVSADRLLAKLIDGGLRAVDIPKVIDAMDWACVPDSIIAALGKAILSKHSPYAPYANDLWLRFGEFLLEEPSHFLKCVSQFGQVEEEQLLKLLQFTASHNVDIKSQNRAWIAEVLAALSATAMVEFSASNDIDLRVLTFAQRAKVFRKLLRDKSQEDLLKIISHQFDDLEQLKLEATERIALQRRFSEVDMLIINPHIIVQGATPKNFPGVLASLYFHHFDGLTEDKIIRPSYWPTHEQIHLKTFNLALRELQGKAASKNDLIMFSAGPVFKKAVLAAMSDLYATCFRKDDAHLTLLNGLDEISHGYLMTHFDEEKSATFALVREELRQSHRRLLALKNGDYSEHDDAALKTSINKLKTYLPQVEEGRYFAMYAFNELIFDFLEWIVAATGQPGEESQRVAKGYLSGLWSLVHKEFAHHHHIFNQVLLYLSHWAAKLELDGVPAAHPQAVL